MYAMYKQVTNSETQEKHGTGWLPPMPDLRDYSDEHREVAPLTKKLGLGVRKGMKLQTSADLRQWCAKIENQGNLGSCTANAAVGIIEYFQRRAYGKNIEGSRLFVYKTTRNLLGVTGDTGAWLRNAMGALVLCGVPPEKNWPYTDQDPDFDEEPPSFVYAIADNYQAVKYFCHDPQGAKKKPADVLDSVKSYIAAGIPSMFGFYGFPSYEQADVKGAFPFPCPGERAEWGHAIIAVGYDDNIKIKNLACDQETTGALLIRNSWGKGWGDKGYGWMPYEYVFNKLATDFWSLLSMDWVDTKQFGI
jgi:C1A family cysteine protease